MRNKFLAGFVLFLAPCLGLNCGKFDLGSGASENECLEVGKARVIRLGVTELETRAWDPPDEGSVCLAHYEEFRETVYARLTGKEGNYRVEVRSDGRFLAYWGLDDPSERENQCLCDGCFVNCHFPSTAETCRELQEEGTVPAMEEEGLGGSQPGYGGAGPELTNCDWVVLGGIPIKQGKDTVIHVVTTSDASWVNFNVAEH